MHIHICGKLFLSVNLVQQYRFCKCKNLLLTVVKLQDNRHQIHCLM